MPALEQFLISPTDTLRRAAEVIDANRCGIPLVVEGNRRLLGTLTDGDLRRAMLRNISLDAPVSVLLSSRRAAGAPDPVTAPLGAPRDQLLDLMQRHRIRQVPIVTTGQEVVEVAVLDELIGARILPVRA